LIANRASASHPFIGRGTPIDNRRRTTGGSLPDGGGVESTISARTIAAVNAEIEFTELYRGSSMSRDTPRFHEIAQIASGPYLRTSKLCKNCGAFTTFVANFWRADLTGTNHGKTKCDGFGSRPAIFNTEQFRHPRRAFATIR
jgi:hypothetical protein